MNIWILQDEPGVNMRDKLKREDMIVPWWNVDRYFKSTTTPHIEEGDKVLVWQPNLDVCNPSGIYAVGEVIKSAYYFPNEKSNYQIKFKITKTLHTPITRELIMSKSILRKMQIVKMPGGHIVFKVEPHEWDVLKLLSKESLD